MTRRPLHDETDNDRNARAPGGRDVFDFPATQSDRQTTGDPRLSIKERYPTHQAYVDAVTAAANALRDDRFLIQEDVDAYIAAAQASNIGN